MLTLFPPLTAVFLDLAVVDCVNPKGEADDIRLDFPIGLTPLFYDRLWFKLTVNSSTDLCTLIMFLSVICFLKAWTDFFLKG